MIAKRDFTDVIAIHNPQTMFKLPFMHCNPLLPPGSDVNLPLCGLPTDTDPPDDVEVDSDCYVRPELCNSPCHHRFLALDGDCSKWKKKYNPTEFNRKY